MFIPEEHGVEVQYAASGVHLKLPKRPLGPARWVLGAFLAPCGLLFASFAASFATVVFRAGGVPLAVGVTVLLLAVPSVLIGAALFCAALGLLIGGSRCAIDVGPDALRVREHVGPFRWTFRRKPRALRRLEIASGGSAPAPVRAGVSLLGGAMLRADFDGGKSLTIAPGYPVGMLREVAGELREACRSLAGARLPDGPPGDGADAVEVAGPDFADKHDPP